MRMSLTRCSGTPGPKPSQVENRLSTFTLADAMYSGSFYLTFLHAVLLHVIPTAKKPRLACRRSWHSGCESLTFSCPTEAQVRGAPFQEFKMQEVLAKADPGPSHNA
jgi:hypothetical protein